VPTWLNPHFRGTCVDALASGNVCDRETDELLKTFRLVDQCQEMFGAGWDQRNGKRLE
jgi:hypothetical protein